MKIGTQNKSQRSRLRYTGAGLLATFLGLALLPALGARAAEILWRTTYPGGPYNDAFSNTAYWNPNQTPTAADVVLFRNMPDGFATTLGLHANVEIQYIRVRDQVNASTVTIDLRGFNLTMNLSSALGGLTGTGGSDTVLWYTDSGAVRGSVTPTRTTVSYGTIRLDSVNWNEGGDATYVNRGMLDIINGTNATLFRLPVGNLAGASAEMNVDASTVTVTSGSSGAVDSGMIGGAGTGTVTVRNGGTLSYTVNSPLRIGAVAGGSGSLTVTGGGSLVSARVVYVGGDASGSQGTGVLRVANGGHFESSRTDSPFVVWGTGSVAVNNGTMRARADLDFRENATLSFMLKEQRATPYVTTDRDLLIAMDGGNGLVNLAFEVDAGHSLDVGQFIALVQVGGARTGLFSGYGEGHTFTEGGVQFELTYAGGLNNDTIGLTVIPEPGALVLVAMGFGLVALRRRS